MSELSRSDSGRPDARLTRRSLAAAAGILAAIGPAAAGKALALGKPVLPGYGGPPHGDKHPPGLPPKPDKCLLVGTRVLTPAGEIAVEALKIGDLVVTESGAVRDIRWIGRSVIERPGAESWPVHARPIRVAKDAFGDGRPHRDLYLSRWHMVHLNGVLIPVGDLVNGRTVTAVDLDVDRLAYFHIELDRHDILIVEGASCESFQVTAGGRAAFDNADQYAVLYGHCPVVDMAPCAPIAAFNGGRSELASRLRSALAPVVDIRRPADVARDAVEARALEFEAA